MQLTCDDANFLRGLHEERERCVAIVEELRRGYETAKNVVDQHGEKELSKRFEWFMNLCDSLIAKMKNPK